MPAAFPPPIGSAGWDRELAALGADRDAVDRALHVVVAEGGAEPDGHDVDNALDEAPPVVAAAALVLFHQERPSYSALMYLRFAANDGDRRLRDWIVRQYAAMLVHGPQPVTDSAVYALDVDWFESEPDAPDLFAALLAQVPSARHGGLLRAAGPLAWPVKRDLFRAAATMPALHASLAAGLAASFYGIHGDVDAPEAADLLTRITVADDSVRAQLVEATTRPLLMRSGTAIVVTDARWAHPDSFLLTMAVVSGPRCWSPRSELVVGGRARGSIAHWSYPLPADLQHRVLPGRPLNQPDLHRITVPPSEAADLVDREVELWPAGLRDYRARGH